MFIRGVPYLGLSAEGDATAMPEASARALGLPSETRGRACIMQLGSGFPKIDLTELAEMSHEGPLTNADLGLVRLCLASTNLREDYARLTELGVAFLCAPQPGKGGLADVATCVDPDGALIELIQVYLDKWAAVPMGVPKAP
jgi:hypothetical protein